MESRYKLTMCRLCLGENECFLNIFEVNDWQGYVPAEVISDLLQFQVSKTDPYPHVVCSTCLKKLNEFRLFKECCQKSKYTYDDMFLSNESPEEHKPEMVEVIESQTSMCSSSIVDPIPSNDEVISSGIIVKVESLEVEEFEFQESNRLSKAVIGISTNSMEISDDFESEITIKEEPLPDVGDEVSGSELCEENPLREALSDVQSVNVKTEPTYYSDSEVNISKVQLTAVDTSTNSPYLQCLEHDSPKSTSNAAVDADLCTRNITANDDSIFEASSSRRLEGQWISTGERMYMAPFIQEDVVVKLEVGSREKDMGGEVEEGRGTSPEKGSEGERKRLECFHCGSVLTTKKSLIKHMMLHGFGHTYDCNVCGKAFESKYGLKRHALIHTGSKPYKCAECSELFSSDSSLKQHMRLHAESEQYICSECKKYFSNKSNLKVHMRLHTGTKPYKCVECSNCFSQNSHLIVHMRSHITSKLYTCAECSKCFRYEYNLTQHMRKHTGAKPYKCVECSKCFSYNSNLIVHMRTHTGSNPYICAECGNTFRYNYNLTQHMRIHTGSKPYKCMVCSKCFAQNSVLKVHMRTHTGYKPYKCAECGKCFSEKSGLKIHMRMHTGCKPFKCEACSKKFAASSNLKTHLLVHTKEKPYECHGCGTRFSQRGSLKLHLERCCKVGIE